MKKFKNADNFIYNRKDTWEKFNKLTEKKSLSFEESIQFGDLYQHIVEDLSTAETFFPENNISSYLNTLIFNAGCKMHKNKKVPFKDFFLFFTEKLPYSFYYFRKEFLLSILMMIIIMVISFSMISKNPEYAEIILSGNMYENAMKDLENLSKFANFDSIPASERSGMSFYIWLNNSKVALLSFVLGITAGVGTIFILITNSMMVAGLCVIYFLNGNFIDFTSIILLHGSLELPAIFLATAAGLGIGKSLLFPGKYRRMELLRKTIRLAFIQLNGTIILLFFAAILEGLVTTQKPDISIRFSIAGTNFLILAILFMYSYLKNLPKNITNNIAS